MYCLPPSYAVGTHSTSRNSNELFLLFQWFLHRWYDLGDISANKLSYGMSNVPVDMNIEVMRIRKWFWRGEKNIRDGTPEVMMPEAGFWRVNIKHCHVETPHIVLIDLIHLLHFTSTFGQSE